MKSALNAVVTPRALSIDGGLLVLRLGVGLSTLLFHGWGKLTGGRETWARVGGSMSNLGIDFAPEFWGLMAALAETVFAALLVVGFLTRPAALLLGFTMLVAAVNHLSREPGTQGAGWNGASHALEILAVCICLFLTGPGRFALSTWVRRQRIEDVPSPS